MSLVEVAILNRLFADPPKTAFITYFAASIPALATLLHLSILISLDNWHTPRLKRTFIALYAYAIVLEFLLLFTPWLVAGLEPFHDYTFTRIPGPLYGLYELFLLVSFSGIIGFPLFGLRRGRSSFARNKCKLWMIALLPMALLVMAIVILLHLKIRWFNSTVTLPLAFAFCYGVIAYAIHNYRLFDIEFFVPWSKIRKRKTVFYERIQSLIAGIAEMSSVQKIIQSISDALHCPVALIGGPTPSLAIAGEAFGIARFPLDELRKVSHIVVANEIAEAMPTTHALMTRHKVAAIVPFHPHSQIAASWMLLGEAFSDRVYSPLDFKTVETLFARLADHFLDNQLLLRSQLLEAQREMGTLHTRLANAWEQIETLRRQLSETKAEEQQKQQQGTPTSNQDSAMTQPDTSERRSAKRISLDEQVAEYETRLIAKTLEHCGGDIPRAAELLGLPIGTLHSKLREIANKENDPPGPQVLFV